MKWISKGKKKNYSISRFFKSFTYAINGFKVAFKTEQNFVFDIIVGLIVIILSFLLKISTTEFIIIIIAVGIAISFELFNTSIEYTVDMAMPEIHPLAKAAKDISAAAVLFMDIILLVVGIIIFVPKIINLF